MGPIRDPNGQIIAVMTLRVDPSEDFSRVLTSSEMRQTFETYAFNEHGELLSESRFDEQLRRIGLIGEDQRSAANIDSRPGSQPGGRAAPQNRKIATALNPDGIPRHSIKG
jgi:hypothetical protein